MEEINKRIGYIYGSLKPITKGHFYLIETASTECDEVNLFVSISDRIRDNEFPIKEKTMRKIWINHLFNVIPKNVNISFVNSPVKSVYELIGWYNENNDNKTKHIIYGDDFDVPKNFPEKYLNKYFDKLSSNKQIELKTFSRTETVDISGTKMRNYLQLGLMNAFIYGLPEPIQKNGKEIWELFLKERYEN